VFVVDDDPDFRRSTERLLRVEGYKVRGFESAEAFLETRHEETPACLVLDVRMPGLSGLELQQRLSGVQSAPSAIVFMTGHGDIRMSVSAMKGGAVEFLTKPFTDVDLFAAIDEALARDLRARAAYAEHEAMLRRYESLTRREREVLLHVVAGKLNKQIAAELGISEITVKTHRSKVVTKMGAASLPELVRMTDSIRRIQP
jgi:FixJ family two-component response regulator